LNEEEVKEVEVLPDILFENNSVPAIELIEVSEVDTKKYQSTWMSIKDSLYFSFILRIPLNIKLQNVPSGVHNIETILESQRIYCVASGEAEGKMKFFAYAIIKSDTECLIELEINIKTKEVKGNIKTTNQTEGNTFCSFLEEILKHKL